ncbi:MAG: rhodanese-like domain-containing protein [Actinomycetota bacterium]
MTQLPRRLLTAVVGASLLAGACGGDAATDASTDARAGDVIEAAPGIRVVTAAEGAAIRTSPPDGLVVLDVRTPEEFRDGHLEGATMIDFYEADFEAQLALLDKDAPYLLYCRSGNRSGQTRAIMEELGFTDVADVGGGILAWVDAGLPVVSP